MSVEAIRADFPAAEEHVYLDNAGTGLHPRQMLQSMRLYLNDWTRASMGEEVDLSRWRKKVEESKGLFAQLIGAKETEIAFTPNTTMGLNIVANMLPYGPGANVVTNDTEFFSNVIVWLNLADRGVETRFVKSREGEVRLEDVERAVDDKTAAVTVGQVGWYHGYRHDLRALSEAAHRRGAYLVVDGVQSVGAMRVDVKRDGVDFLSCGGYKWLLGPPGAGFLYIRQDLVNRFKPPFVGGRTMRREAAQRNIYEVFDLYAIPYSEEVSRFEVTHLNEVAYVGMYETMKLILERGPAFVEEKIRALDERLVEGLLARGYTLQTPMDPAKRFGIVNFKVENNREVQRRLQEKKVIVSARIGGIRVSPHFFNTEEDIDTLLDALDQLRRSSEPTSRPNSLD